MLDIGWDEMLFTAIVAIVVIGPKELPRALRTAGRWIGKIRRVSGHFRTGIETMIREAELEEMEQKWREQNARIMAESGAADAAVTGGDAVAVSADPVMHGPPALPAPQPASAEAAASPASSGPPPPP